MKQKELEVNVARELAQRDLKQKEVEVNVAKEMAQRERDARERMIASQQQQARKMPIDLQIRKAAIAGGYVLQLQSNQSITVRLDVMRSAQTHAKELNVVPGRMLEYGGLQGWSFKSGDRVVLSNRLFDSMSFSVP